MPKAKPLTYLLTLKATGGFSLLFSDCTVVDIDLTGAEMRDLASQLIELARYVDRASPIAVRTSSATQVPQCL
ncbi:MAG: hypothetical protein AB7I32_10930 [Gammaproteobacteria bacterium]